MTNLESVSLLLLAAGMVMTALFIRNFNVSCLALGCLAFLIGFSVLNWVAALAVWSLPTMLLLFLARDTAYRRRYPVFASALVESFQDANGLLHHIYIREWRSRFIIGVDWECRIDGTMMRRQTRWKDRFADYASAERELRRRGAAWQRGELALEP